MVHPQRLTLGHHIPEMELRQLAYFVRIVELGSISRAARDLQLGQSALSQQISRLEGELSTRLLRRAHNGVVPTEAGLAFFREAQLTLRHSEQAKRAAQEARLSGSVSVGLASTTASILGLPLMTAMRERYPDVRLHLVESMSGHISGMLNARQLDLAVLFDTAGGRRWSVSPLLEERLFLIGAREMSKDNKWNHSTSVQLTELAGTPLILPTGSHGLRSTVDSAFAHVRLAPELVAEVDSLALLMEMVSSGIAYSVQPWAALGRFSDATQRFHWAEISDAHAYRTNSLCSLSDDELSPAGLATRVVLTDCVRNLVRSGVWVGAQLIHHET
jgi:LysR family tcuABC transcriptional regulator